MSFDRERSVTSSAASPPASPSSRHSAPDSDPSLRGRLLKIVALALVIVVAALVLHATGFQHVVERSWIDEHVRGHGLEGHLVFLAAVALVTGLGMPRQAAAFVGGYAFGVVSGTLLSVLGTTLGATASYLFGRSLGPALLPRRLKKRIGRLRDFLGVSPFAMAVAIRFMPLGHNLTTNVLAGVGRVRALPFLLGSACGYVPQMLVFALIGKGLRVDPLWRFSLAAALFLTSSAIGLSLYRRHRQRVEEVSEEDEPTLRTMTSQEIGNGRDENLDPASTREARA